MNVNQVFPSNNLSYIFQDNAEFRRAIDLWFNDEQLCMQQYGHISNWDTVNVTNMNGVFQDQVSFNENIQHWNTSNVTCMNYMFYDASMFNQPLERWNTSNVINMSGMFADATSFNQSLECWDVSMQYL